MGGGKEAHMDLHRGSKQRGISKSIESWEFYAVFAVNLSQKYVTSVRNVV